MRTYRTAIAGGAILGNPPYRFGWISPDKSCAEKDRKKRMKVIYKIKLPAITGQEGLKALEVVEALYQSAESGRRVKL